MYKPTNYIKKYIEEHGEFVFTDEEIDKMFEVFYAFHSSIGMSRELQTSEEAKKFRKDTCLGCSHFEKYHDDTCYCNACGCNIDNKISIPTEECPVNKWFPDLKLLKEEVKTTVNNLNLKSNIDQQTIEEIEFKYSKIIKKGTKHE